MFDAKQIFKHGFPTYFLVTIIGKDLIFSKIWCYPQTKNERWYFFNKIHGNMIFTSNILKIWSFQKGLRRDMKFFYLLERRYFFSRKHGIFSLDEKRERGDLSQEIYGNMTFSNWYASLQKKNQRRSYPAKIHLKVIGILDWHPRKSSSNFLYLHGDL